MNKAKLKHFRCQHPVGQGFFHSGRIEIDNAQFNYVYDCGSGKNAKRSTKSPLGREIKRYVGCNKKNKIDILFLSHLHNDHVNGLDQLLTKVEAETVILPYLTEYDKFFLVAEAEAEGEISGTYLQLVIDPTSWFGERGTENIIFVKGGESQEGDIEKQPQKPTIPDRAEQITLNIDGIGSDFRGNAKKRYKIKKYNASHKTPLNLKVDKADFNWMFYTYVSPNKEWEEEFKDALSKKFKTGLDESRLKEIIRNEKELKLLKECYKDITNNDSLNLTSLSLYSGPVKISDKYYYNYSPHMICFGYEHFCCTHFESGRCGWLGTGDSNLSDDKDFNDFSKHFNSYFEYISTFALPHHGASNNYNDEISDLGPQIFIASAGSNNIYGHPGLKPINDILSRGYKFHLTSEEISTAFYEHFELIKIK